MSTADLATLVGTALDNALEAVSGTGDADRWIRLDVRTRRGFVLIEVENPVAPARSAPGRTGPIRAVTDGSAYGFGYGAMRSAAEAYGGQLTTTESPRGTFTLRVLLPIPAELPHRGRNQ
nr:GHKL domain-containing protein [Actinomyces sp. 565]